MRRDLEPISIHGAESLAAIIPRYVLKLDYRAQREWARNHGFDLVRRIEGGGGDTMSGPAGVGLSSANTWTVLQTFQAGLASVLTGVSGRYVGATADAAPTTGMYTPHVQGDVAVSYTGKVWICTANGSPGTWQQITGTGAGVGTANIFTADQYFKSGRPWFDVCGFGADPTGAADSTTAFINACAAIPAGGGIVFIPSGLYKIQTGDIPVRSNTTILGTGGHGNGYNDTGMPCRLLTAGTPARVFNVRADVAPAGRKGNVTMIGFSIDGNGTTGGTSALIDITDSDMFGAKMVSCVRGAGDGILAGGTIEVFLLDDCTLYANGTHGLEGGNLSDTIITNSTFTSNGVLRYGSGLYAAYCGGPYIINNHMEFNTGGGAGMELAGGILPVVYSGLYDRNHGPGFKWTNVQDGVIQGVVCTRNGVTQGATADTNADFYLNGTVNVSILDSIEYPGFNDQGTGAFTPYQAVTVVNTVGTTLRNIHGIRNLTSNRFLNKVGSNPGLKQDGANMSMTTEDTTAGTFDIQGANFNVKPLGTPAAPGVTPAGGTGATTYSYHVVATNGGGDSLPSATTTITNGVASLSAAQYNQITWPVVDGAQGYKIIRTAGGGSAGVLPSANGNNTVVSVPNGMFGVYKDIGAVAAAYTDALIPVGGILKLNNQTTFRSGVGVPANSVGVDGDVYFRYDGGGAGLTHLYYRNSGAYIGIA